MKKQILGVAMTCLAGSAMAVDTDMRWMLTPSLNFTATDSNKGIDSDFGFGIAIGKFVNENWSLDLELDQGSFDFESGPGSADQYGIGLMTRYHFRNGDVVRPFIGFGAGILDVDAPGIKDSDFMLNASLGIRRMVTDRVGFIAEVNYRLDNNEYFDTSDSYDDWMYKMGLSIALGAKADAPMSDPIVEPAPQLDSDGDGVSDQDDRCPNTPAEFRNDVDVYGCHDGDDDNDGVKNSMDQCPNTRAGATVDEVGCEVQVVIELQGVHFEFDKATLKPESIEILDAAVATLGEHGTIAVEVAGHTDSIGSEAYNEGLSDRRAKVVYDYLLDNGIAADRMTWKGYGELSPIATNDTEEGRAKNRRTELVIED